MFLVALEWIGLMALAGIGVVLCAIGIVAILVFTFLVIGRK